MDGWIAALLSIPCLTVAAETFCADGATALLQLDLKLQAPAASSPPASPLKYLHIPKCGTSFLNAIAHTPKLCPGVDNLGFHVESEQDFWRQCPQVCDESQFTCIAVDNTPESIGGSYDLNKGHLITMLRQPEQRILAAYHDSDHRASHYSSALAYAQTVQGLVSCQLTGSHPVEKCSQLGEANASLAAQRLREGFVFVGLFEEWDLSLCLFRKIFGGQCWYSDFETQLWTYGEETYGAGGYNVSELEGFRDTLDGVVYDEGKRIFQELLTSYKVTPESCSSCWAFRRSSAAAQTAFQLLKGCAAMARLPLLVLALSTIS